MAGPVYISGSGGICAVGIGIPQIAASVRAGIARFAESSVYNRRFEPIRMALLPEDALELLLPEVDALPLPARVRRLLRLAAPALREAAKVAGNLAEAPLLLALPEPPPPGSAAGAMATPQSPWMCEDFLPLLFKQSGVALAAGQSEVFLGGRAGALLALQKAVGLLQAGQTQTVVVGGVDTYLDLRLLAILDEERRLLGGEVMDGFIPGEGAAFVVLTTAPPDQGSGLCAIGATGSALDPGHRYGTEPARGEGLANALEALREQGIPGGAPMQCMWAGFNGENFGAKEWGIARIRHSELFDPAMLVEHPADCYGDLGAATGAMLLALADRALRLGHRAGPMLVWASSDREPVACACIARAGAAGTTEGA